MIKKSTESSVAASSNPSGSVQKSKVEWELINKVEPILGTMGYRLWDLEVGGGPSPILRITLEKSSDVDSDQIGIDDCSKVHEELGPLFDVWDPIEGAYTLEVSSPGEKAKLRLLRHFKMAVGDRVKCQTIDAIPMPAPAKPRRNWEGVLTQVNENEFSIIIKDELGEHALKMEQIRSAQWLREWTLKDLGQKSAG